MARRCSRETERERERERRLRRTDLTYNRRRAGVRRSSDGRHVCQCRNLSLTAAPRSAWPRLRSDGYERTPVFLGSTCFVLRPCGSAWPARQAPRANFFFRRTSMERDGNPYFLSATFLLWVYGIIDNAFASQDAWLSGESAGLAAELVNKLRVAVVRESYRSNAFPLFRDMAITKVVQ